MDSSLISDVWIRSMRRLAPTRRDEAPLRRADRTLDLWGSQRYRGRAETLPAAVGDVPSRLSSGSAEESQAVFERGEDHFGVEALLGRQFPTHRWQRT